MTEHEAPKQSRLILIVDDEALICLLVETILFDAGFAVASANTVADALAAITLNAPDLAILDLNLRGEKVYPVAQRLAELDIPFVFATGGSAQDVEAFAERPCIDKPFNEDEILETIAGLLA